MSPSMAIFEPHPFFWSVFVYISQIVNLLKKQQQCLLREPYCCKMSAFQLLCTLYLWQINHAEDNQEDSRGFATCDGNIDIDKPYRIVVDANDRGSSDKLLFQQFEIPSSPNDLRPNDIVIQVKASGINYIDTYHRSGLYPGVTNIGLEGSGIVTMIGNNVTKYAVNDKVF